MVIMKMMRELKNFDQKMKRKNKSFLQFGYEVSSLDLYFRLRREAAEVDRQLEAAQAETHRLQTLLRQREAAVQALRERVMRQRAERARRLAAKEAEEVKENSSEEEDPEQKADMQKSLDMWKCFEMKTSDYYHAKFYQNRTTLSDMRA